MSTCTVLVAYREALPAEGIAAALARFPGIVPVGSVSTSNEALKLGERVDSVAMDARLPDADRAASALRRRGVRVVIVGVGDAQDGSIRVSPDARVRALAAALSPGSGMQDGGPGRLTRREREVLSLVAKGLAGKQVARQLGISPKTVERHKTKIFSKLSVPNAAAAANLFAATSQG